MTVYPCLSVPIGFPFHRMTCTLIHPERAISSCGRCRSDSFSPPAQATDAFAAPLEKARCLSLLADLAFDPRCARTLFRGGAVPQMLLNAQGCTHVELIDVYGGGAAAPGVSGGFGAGSDGRASPALSATSGESGTRSRTATEDLDADQEEEEEQQQHEAAAPTTGGGSPSEVACCRCRQAMRLLARLVRGLPGETPAVVVRHSGLRSIVQILEDGAAEAAALASPGGGDGCGLPAATEAAVREALEVREHAELFLRCSDTWTCAWRGATLAGVTAQ